MVPAAQLHDRVADHRSQHTDTVADAARRTRQVHHDRRSRYAGNGTGPRSTDLEARRSDRDLAEAAGEADMLLAAFGDEKFFAPSVEHFPKGSPFYSDAGAATYNKADMAGAKKLLAEAKYDNTPIRILNSKQYEFHNRLALVMAENLKEAGFNATLDVVDWATLIQRRGDPALWDVYVTHSAFLPEPMLSPPQLSDGAPGWWKTPAKDAALAAFNSETDPIKRGALWGKVQQVVADEVPYVRVGNFAALSGASAKMKGYQPMPWPALTFDWRCLGWAILLAGFYLASGSDTRMFTNGVMNTTAVSAGQWWRIFTAMQLHADLGHLFSNLSIGILLLGIVMARYGAGLGLLAAYLAGACGNVLSLLLNSWTIHSYGLGASGMVMGALGMIAAQSLSFGQLRHKPWKYVIGGVAAGVMLFLLFGLSPNSDILAHFGGFVSGCLLGAALLVVPAKWIQTARLEVLAGLALGAMVLITWRLALRPP